MGPGSGGSAESGAGGEGCAVEGAKTAPGFGALGGAGAAITGATSRAPGVEESGLDSAPLVAPSVFVVSPSMIFFTTGARRQPFASGPFRIGGFDREIIPPLLVDFFDNDRHNVANVHRVRYFSDSKRRDFGNVHQSILIRRHLHKRAEVHEAYDFSFEAKSRDHRDFVEKRLKD